MLEHAHEAIRPVVAVHLWPARGKARWLRSGGFWCPGCGRPGKRACACTESHEPLDLWWRVFGDDEIVLAIRSGRSCFRLTGSERAFQRLEAENGALLASGVVEDDSKAGCDGELVYYLTPGAWRSWLGEHYIPPAGGPHVAIPGTVDGRPPSISRCLSPLDWTVPDARLSVEGCELDPDVSARTLKAMALSRLLAYIYARGRSQQESNLEIVERIDRQVAALRTAEAGGRAAVASHADGDPTLDVSVVLTIVGISLDNLDELLDQLAASRLLDDQEDEG